MIGDQADEGDVIPTPEEVAERAASIREGWSEETRRERVADGNCVGRRRDRVGLVIVRRRGYDPWHGEVLESGGDGGVSGNDQFEELR